MENKENEVNVIMPEEVNNADVKLVINMSEIMQQYQKGLKSSMEYGISLGQEMARSGDSQTANFVPKIQADTSASGMPQLIAIADKFSYGVYTNAESFKKGQVFYHAATTEVSYVRSFNEALQWAYDKCSSKNPGKNIPLYYKKNWRNVIRNSETDGVFL